MPKSRLVTVPTLAAFAMMILLAGICGCGKKLGPPPQSKVEVVVDTLHGVAIEDPYRWLEDQESAETRAWIDAQNVYTESHVQAYPGKAKIEKRLDELYRIDYTSSPSWREGRYFLYKKAADQDQYIIYMREGLHGEDQVLVDPHGMDPEHTTSVDMTDISLDGKLMAYSVRQGGAEEEEVHFLNVDTREELDEFMPVANYFGVQIKADNSGYYYSHYSDTVGCRIYYHEFGTDMADDPLLFGEGYGPEIIVGLSLSEDGRYLGLGAYYGSSGKKNDLYYMDAVKGGKIKTLINDVEAKFYGRSVGNKVYIQTNWNAPNWRIMVADLGKPNRKHWKEVIPTSETAVIEGFSLVGGKIVVRYLEDVQSKVKIFDADGKLQRELSPPALGTISGLSGHWDGNESFYSFVSFHMPRTIYRYDVATGEQEVFDKSKIEIDSDNMVVKQVWFDSKDGTRVPMFVVHGKDLKLDGNNPTMIYSYGGFNSSSTPYFSRTATLFCENGGVYCLANLRGGGEFGEEWHKAAMFEKKQNTFDDLYAAAQWLIDNKYTNPSKLACSGGSNGGLTVGVAMTQRPDLFKAVVCTYPLLDMLRFHLTLMGPFWTSEYGSADGPDQFEYINEYSPYQNVTKGTIYPAVLFVTGDADTRVDPMHARKMTAMMQAATGSTNPILLHYDTKAGHMGGTPTSKLVQDVLVQVGFLFTNLGVNVVY